VNIYNLDIIHDKLSVQFGCLFSTVDSEKQGNLFLISLPSGLLQRSGLLNRFNHLASFMKIAAHAHRDSMHENTNTSENYHIR
jgi:hypothetical protein